VSELAPGSGSGPRDCGLFFLDVVAQYTPEQIVPATSPALRTNHADVEQLIEQVWQKETARAEQEGRTLFNGRLCRLVDYEASERQLRLSLGEVSYKEFLGTNLTQAHVRYLHGADVLANPLGVSAALVSKDGYVLLGRRSRKVVYHAGRIHPVGGMVEPPSRPGQLADPAGDMLHELQEETGMAPERVAEQVCLGLVRDKHIVQPELVFDIRLDATVTEVLRGKDHAVDGEEHSEFVPVRSHPSAVVTFIEQQFAALTPVALATLLLYGQRHWGSGWFAAARGYLRSVI